MRLIDADELKKKFSERSYWTYTHEYGDAIPIGWIISGIDHAPTVEPKQGKWIYPYHDTIIGKKRVGKSIKQCSECDAYFCNNIPWDAKYCPICGSYNEESNGNAVDNI